MEEEDFPRGGASALSPLEVRKIKEKAEKDVLFGKSMLETGGPKKNKKKKTNGKAAKDNKNALTDTGFEETTKQKHVETLTFKKLAVGMKVLGAVKEVNELDVTMSLPDGLTGFVHITNINEKITEIISGGVTHHAVDEDGEEETELPSLQKFFSIGSLVPCAILELQSTQQHHKKVKLSLNPQQVNSGLSEDSIQQGMVLPGFVTSVEDHGYLISFGISGTKGFLSKKSVKQGELSLGQPLQLMVKSVSGDSRVVKVALPSEEESANAVASEDYRLKFSALLPGMLVKARVKKFTPRGMLLTFLGGFEGSVNLSHLCHFGGSGLDLAKTYPKKVSGRLVFVNPSSKSAGLSLHEDIVKKKAHTFQGCTMGDIISDATVTRLDQGQGLLMGLPDGESGYVHISRVADERMEKLGKKYKEGTKHRCRIVGFNTLDGLVTLTMEKSVIEQPFLRYRDVKPGSIVKGKVITVEKFGMLVSLSDHIRGLCTQLHLADVHLKNPEKKLKEGKVIRCRVLTVEPDRRRMHLTHKKTLVDSDEPIFTAFEDAKPGMRTHGFITSVKDSGCLVTFYNNVKGFLPRAELGLSSGEDPRSMYYVGQVLLCHVVSCKPEEGKIRLSLKATPSSADRAAQKDLKTGTLTDIDVVGSSSAGLDVLLQPSGAPAFLPSFHLSDFPSHWQPLLDMRGPPPGEVRTPRRLTDALYYGRNKDKSHVVSLKPSLLKAASQGSLLKNFNELEIGTTLPGFVKQVMSYGVFVEFAPHVFGLAPNSFLSNEFLSEPSKHFKVGQSVVAKVREIDVERRRFLVSLRLSDCIPEGSGTDPGNTVTLLEKFLQEREQILNHLSQTSDEMKSLTEVLPGSCVEAKVTSVKHQGIHLQLTDGVQGFTPHQLAKGASCQPGQVVYGCVLDVDVEHRHVVVTLESNVVEERKSALSSKRKIKKIKAGKAVEAAVQLVKAEHIIVLLPLHQYRLAVAPAKLHLNDVRDASKRFAVGQKYSALVHSSSCCHGEEVPVVTLQDKRPIDKENIEPGAVITAQVKAVKDTQLNVSLFGGKCFGRVHVSQIADDVTEGECLLDSFHRGDKVQVKLLGFRDGKSHKFLPITHKNFTNTVAELTMTPSVLASSDMKPRTPATQNGTSTETADVPEEVGKKLQDFKAGEQVTSFVKSVQPHCVWMVVSPSVSGRVGLLHASSDTAVLGDLSSHFKVGAAYKCTVLGVDTGLKALDLSLSVKPDSALEPGQLVVGRVTKVVPGSGLFVHLPLQRCGLASLTDLQDEYTDDPLDKFEARQFIKCFVLSKKDGNRYDLSLRPSRTEASSTSNDKVEEDKPKDREIKSLSELDVGDIVRGYIKSVSDVGVFVSLARHIIARVQIKNLSHFFVKKWKPLFPVGKLVKGKVLSIDPTKGHVELSLKGKDVGGPDPAPKPKERKDKEKQSRKRKKENKHQSDSENAADDQQSDGDELVKRLKFSDSSEDEAESDKDSKDSSDEQEEVEVPPHEQPRLQLSAGFDWSGEAQDAVGDSKKRELESDDEETSDSDAEASAQTTRKKTKRQKRAAKKAEQEFLYKTEQALLDEERAPESAEEFDRLVLASPNSSVVWLQYMALHLHATEIDKARAVADRALKTISFREEQEKLNIFVALMNLENLYGTQESLVKVFDSALQQNEPKKVFFHLINIYDKSNKMELAEELYQTMTKRFSKSKKVWVNFGTFLMKHGKVEAARNLLQRSLKSLAKRKHIEAIVKFAILEFKHAEPQRGVTMFESVLSNYPKRTDLWSVYIDMVIKQGDPEPARQIFERIIHMNLSSKKMKFIFKRYLEFERTHGDDQSVENVKTKAMEFVESKVALN